MSDFNPNAPESTGDGKARATLEQLMRWGRVEIIAGPDKDPTVVVTKGVEDFAWRRVSKGHYERLTEGER